MNDRELLVEHARMQAALRELLYRNTDRGGCRQCGATEPDGCEPGCWTPVLRRALAGIRAPKPIIEIIEGIPDTWGVHYEARMIGTPQFGYGLTVTDALESLNRVLGAERLRARSNVTRLTRDEAEFFRSLDANPPQPTESLRAAGEQMRRFRTGEDGEG